MTTPSELNAALHAKGATVKCPICGANEWIGMGTKGEAEQMVLVSRLNPARGLEGFEVLGLYCDNCGFVRLHRKDSLGLG